ncbi:MAG TPA: ABC transporter substrate-binding protein, partial [Nevskiaceae bacterium]|nr:ABC transporter substrate-binding protein [Nevskiaceae bacterium]
RMYCKRLGIGIASDQIIHGFADVDEITNRLQLIRESGADAIAYLAFGATAYNVLVKGNEALKRWGWDPHRVTITTWVGITCPGFTYFPIDMADPKHHPLLEGWVGVDQTHEANAHWAAARERFAARHEGRKPFHCYAALGYDMAHVIALALARADEKTSEGVKRALETIRLLPAVSGGPGTVISFGPHDRRGLKGADYLVLRTIRNGKEQLA